MDIKMNTDLINKTVDDVVSTVNFLCKNDLPHLELSCKLDALNEKMDALQTLVVYSDDHTFTKNICAMQLITDNFNKEIMRDLGATFSTNFRESQLNFLRNISTSFDIKVNEVDNVDSISENKEKIKKEYAKKVNYTKKEYAKKDTEQTVDDIIKATNEKLDSYFTSPKDIKEYLDYMAKFYKYSIGNCSMIQKQFKGALAVGSFKVWKDKGFNINKGEKGIQILVPTPVKNFFDENNDVQPLYKATKEQKEKIKKGILKEAPSHLRYKKGYVFDVSQTNAKAEDLPNIFPNKWIEGDVKDYDKMYKSMENIAYCLGVNIIPPPFELGVSKGMSFPLTNEVTLNPRNSQLQNIKTLAHELAHAKLHTKTTENDYTHPEREFEAELVAYSVCSYFGLDTSDYSLSYLDFYTKNTDIKEKKKLLKEIKDTAQEFIEIIEETLYTDLEINKTIENNLAENKSIDNTQVSNDKKNIYVKFLWSENSNIQENSIFEFNKANELLEILTKIHLAENKPGYNKTKFELHFNKECTDKFYTGRFDIGDGEYNDLKEYIHDNSCNSTKNILFGILGIKEKKKTKSINKDIYMDFEL